MHKNSVCVYVEVADRTCRNVCMAREIGDVLKWALDFQVTTDDLKQLMQEDIQILKPLVYPDLPAVVLQEMPGADWMEKFWTRVLTAPPAPTSGSLAMRLRRSISMTHGWLVNI